MKQHYLGGSMKSYIIGTAGHVDHGKTTLIKALTGVDTDRLKEEKERGISIELGFASLPLPSGAKAGVVDVPGHEKFVRQMLAGIGGIDLVLLVIAADEGVMPQTTEHLEIIDLLQIPRGIIVLTKVDLVEPDWCELVKLEVAEALRGTVLAQSEIIEVSVTTGVGLDYLLTCIDEKLTQLSGKADLGPCRLPIDRSFSVPGFGTVVTGTMYHGNLQVGDPVVIEPGEIKSRVRSMQVHGNKVEEGFAGQRVAINLPNVELNDIPRGATLLSPGFLNPSQILDLSLILLDSAEMPLVQRQRVRFHIGTKEVFGRIHLLDREEIEPGAKVYAQILLEEPVVAARRDRFIIRLYSPARTIAGGIIIDVGNKKCKRYSEQSVAQMVIKEMGTPEDLISEQLSKVFVPQTTTELGQTTGLDIPEIEQALVKLGEQVDSFIIEGQSYWFHNESLLPLRRELTKLIDQYHKKYNLRTGVLKEEIKSRLFTNWNSKIYSGLLKYLQDNKIIEVSGNYINLPGFKAEPQGKLQPIASQVISEFKVAKLSPPDWEAVMNKYKIDQTLHEELLQYYLHVGILVKVTGNLYFSFEALDEAKKIIEQLLKEKSEFIASDAKDRLNTSRKYLIPLLEYFDTQKITRRIGDKRVIF
jgi:selenocysteine-specific elongation factor